MGLLAILVFGGCQTTPAELPVAADAGLPSPDARVVAIHEQAVFADMHAHPSRFHRANIESNLAEEIEV
jgi:hypothetical protein